jgi:hypothetical protein
LTGAGTQVASFDSRESENFQPELIVFVEDGMPGNARNETQTTTGEKLAEPAPGSFSLRHHPNPFRAGTEFEVALPFAGEISLKVFDLHGREVINLADERKEAGRFRFTWNARDQQQHALASGVYFAVLRYQSAEKSGTVQVRTQRVLYLK